MKDVNKIIHEDLRDRFHSLLDSEPVLRGIIYDVLLKGCAYIVGGFVRDVINDRHNRDLDIIVDIPPMELKHILENYNCEEYINRLGGAKLKLPHVEVDVWTVDTNWAFANNLVKLNDNDKLNSIAKGCFYNYDALVVSVPKFMYNLKYYNDFIEKKELDIIQRQSLYKKLNPTVEANIIRAVYIQKQYYAVFSDNLKDYLKREILALQDKWGDVINRLLVIKGLYSKYDIVSEMDLKTMVNELFINTNPSLFDEAKKVVF